MSRAGKRYAAGLAEVRSLGEAAAEAQDAFEAAQEDLLRRIDADFAAGRVTRSDVTDAYFEFRDATSAEPGFAVRWNALVRVSYRDIHRVTHNGIGRPNNPDGTWSGPFPLPQSARAPMAGVPVVYTLFDRQGSRCYIGSSRNLRARLKRHAGQGKEFTRWHAIGCKSRGAAYDLETQMICEHTPYMNRLGVGVR